MQLAACFLAAVTRSGGGHSAAHKSRQPRSRTSKRPAALRSPPETLAIYVAAFRRSPIDVAAAALHTSRASARLTITSCVPRAARPPSPVAAFNQSSPRSHLSASIVTRACHRALRPRAELIACHLDQSPIVVVVFVASNCGRPRFTTRHLCAARKSTAPLVCLVDACRGGRKSEKKKKRAFCMHSQTTAKLQKLRPPRVCAFISRISSESFAAFFLHFCTPPPLMGAVLVFARASLFLRRDVLSDTRSAVFCGTRRQNERARARQRADKSRPFFFFFSYACSLAAALWRRPRARV